MIQSFANDTTALIFRDQAPKKGFPLAVVPAARRKLMMIDAAVELDDLRGPPSNKLHKLGGDRRGLWAIWINTQWRVCFSWRDGHAFDVEITDYH